MQKTFYTIFNVNYESIVYFANLKKHQICKIKLNFNSLKLTVNFTG